MASTKLTCAGCGAQFQIELGRGKHRKYCGRVCAKQAASSARFRAARDAGDCEARGCKKQVRSAGAKFCEAHYMRQRRNGHLHLVAEVSPPPKFTTHTQGYVLEYAPGHWIAERTKQSRVYQHRRVFFDAHGEGPFLCHWCSVQVTWDDMHVDHVNAVRNDNDLSNLVASCAGCNHRRGHSKMKATARAKSATKISWAGESLTLGEWAERIGISRASIASRIASGWAVERALTEVRGKTGPRTKRA
jgi:hypothetical protein